MYNDTKNVKIDLLDQLMSDDKTKCAWTWNKLTDSEKKTFKTILYGMVKDSIIYDPDEYEREWDRAQDLYSDLLKLVGYTPSGWRETIKNKEVVVKLSIDETGTVTIKQ